MGKTFFISSLLLFLLLSPDWVFANGLVPCGPGTGKEHCELCDFFVLLNNVLRFVLEIIPFVAAAFLIIAGIMLYFAGARPALLTQAKNIITYVVVGMVIILTAWVIVNTIFSQLGVIDIAGWRWYEVECP